MAITYKKSKSGFYRVKLTAVFEHQGFFYKPSQEITVNEEILQEMIAADVVENVLSAD